MFFELPGKFIWVIVQERRKKAKGRVPLEGRKPFFLDQAKGARGNLMNLLQSHSQKKGKEEKKKCCLYSEFAIWNDQTYPFITRSVEADNSMWFLFHSFPGMCICNLGCEHFCTFPSQSSKPDLAFQAYGRKQNMEAGWNPETFPGGCLDKGCSALEVWDHGEGGGLCIRALCKVAAHEGTRGLGALQQKWHSNRGTVGQVLEWKCRK